MRTIRALSFPLLLISLTVFVLPLQGQAVWEGKTYPDEARYQFRISGMIEKIGQEPFAQKSKAPSTCPDTGLPVYTWAVEGEEIVSPYSGRRYVQGPTGYFGPKARNEKGEITAFGGDPLKKDLPPATAHLLLHPDDNLVKSYLSIPGNLSQQYHFAAKNWARFYPLLGDVMGEDWKTAFQEAVAGYAESRRPSDGGREHAYLSRPHDLVGEEGHLLGGNIQDGGTENHKVMWRTSALLYAQLFPKGSKVSGHPLEQAEKRTKFVLREFGQKLLETGNGEYDSQIYYPHSMYGFLNLHDFSPDPETQQLATFLLDYYLATYGMKTVDGAIAGAQKRGFLTSHSPNEMRSHLWGWFGTHPGNTPKTELISSLHQATSSYRPNRIVWDLVHKNVPLPFEAKMARPTYHLTQTNAFQEYFYCSENFAMGSVAMTMVDNPTQQVVWSLVVKGSDGPLSIGGMQPRYLDPAGHSPYTQTLQHQNTIIVMTGQTGKKPGGELEGETAQRFKHAADPLLNLPLPADEQPNTLKDFFQKARKSAATWLFLPSEILQLEVAKGRILIELEKAYLSITPLSDEYHWLSPEPETLEDLGRLTDGLMERKVLVVLGEISGFVLEVAEKNDFSGFADYKTQMFEKSSINLQGIGAGKVTYKTYNSHQLEMQYQDTRLRASGSINGKPVDYENWADGGVYDSPYVKIKNGTMRLSNGKESYEVNFKRGKLVYE